MTINKKLGLTFGVIIILISASVAYSQYRDNQPRTNPTSAPLETTNPNASTGTTPTTNPTATRGDDSEDDDSPTSSTAPTPVTKPVSKPVTTPTPVTTTAGTYTLAQIATHNNASSCWTAVNGDVYDVTAWINQHPGGAQAILGMCGIDGSDAFNGQHGGQRRPATELASFKIGTLAQ